MNQSSIPPPSRIRSALYPFAFPVAAILLGFVTYQIVNRLAIETASTKLTTIAKTGATAVSVWCQNNQNAIELFASSEFSSNKQLRQAFENEDALDLAFEELEQAFIRFSDKFQCIGLALYSSSGDLLHQYQKNQTGNGKDLFQQVSVKLEAGDRLAFDRPLSVPKLSTPTFELERDVVFFSTAADTGRNSPCTLVVAVSTASGLNEILDSVKVGKTGFAFLVDRAAQKHNWAQVWPSGRTPSISTVKMLNGVFKSGVFQDGDIPVPETSENAPLTDTAGSTLGLDSSTDADFVGARQLLNNSNTALVTMAERQDVFKATVALKRILLLVLGLSLLASVMNWTYVFHLSSLRTRVSSASDAIRKLGQYNLEEKIGEGGMGVVYRASHSMLQRPTAVKLILPDRASDKSIENFEREVMLTSRLTHPNTIAIYDYGRNEEGIFYYAMEYLNGINLATLVHLEGPQPWQRVVHILTQVCDSLAEAHAAGLIHRDIKPENVMICQRGNRHDVVKVLDFGLAGDFSKDDRSEATRMQGTPAYMAPEAIIDPDDIDPRVDIYAVGAVGYYLLAGKHIFSGDTASSILSQQLNSKPIPLTQRRPEISDNLQALIMSCLEKDRELRPGQIETLRHELVSLSQEIWTETDAKAGWKRIEGRRSEDAKFKKRDIAPALNSISKTLEF